MDNVVMYKGKPAVVLLPDLLLVKRSLLKKLLDKRYALINSDNQYKSNTVRVDPEIVRSLKVL